MVPWVGWVGFDVAAELFERAGAGAQVLFLLDHLHDAQHEFEILVLGLRRAATAAAAAVACPFRLRVSSPIR